MNPNKKFYGFFFLALMCASGLSCGSSSNNSGAVDRGATAGATPAASSSPTPATFTQVNTQILQTMCISCHGAGGVSPNLSSYSTFATNTAYIVPGNSTSSVLFQQVQSGAMPKGGTPLTAAELSLIQQWIDAGALDN